MTSELPPDHETIAEKIRSGEFYRESRQMYDFSVHDPMAERYLYVFITAFSLLIFLIAFVAMEGLYPLDRPVPFIVSTDNIVDDLPHISSMLARKGEKANDAFLRFMVENYVGMREEYDIDTFDRDIGGVKAQSDEAVFGEFQQAIDPRNPESPITLYQRHSRRKISIISSRRVADQDSGGMQVIFDATVENAGDVKKSRWQADVAFKYSGIELNEKTEKVNPVSFTVTRYRTKRLEDINQDIR